MECAQPLDDPLHLILWWQERGSKVPAPLGLGWDKWNPAKRRRSDKSTKAQNG